MNLASNRFPVLARVTDQSLEPDAQRRFVDTARAGAVVSFAGVIRDHDAGRAVESLRYEAHPTAGGVLADLASRTASSGNALAIAVEHRIGELAIGDVALLCSVSAAHRAEAFDICARLVDAVKAEVPIWKQQRFVDGSTEWVGL